MSFVRPSLPSTFNLKWRLPGGSSDVWGPFARNDVSFEHDGATFIYVGLGLPIRLGVLRQDGPRLELYPSGEVTVEALDCERTEG